MLIESYELEITVATHSTEQFEYEAIAHLVVDIREALPYLNATLSRALYVPSRPSLSWPRPHIGRPVMPSGNRGLRDPVTAPCLQLPCALN